MTDLVADTSGLVSLGTVAETDHDPIDVVIDHYAVVVPELVVSELENTAAYEDVHGKAAQAVLDRIDDHDLTIVDTAFEAAFPLDDGENAAVTAANARSAELFLCDEFNALPLIHASLTDTRLVTTPTLLRVLHRRGVYSATDVRSLLDRISDARSWGPNSYVQRVIETL